MFFLTRKFPLFHSSDDIEALMELATIFGKKRMEKTATLHSKTHSPASSFVLRDAVPRPRLPDERPLGFG